MIDTELKDAGARRAIVEDLDTCILVEAGAGSGKTRSLVERMVSLITENKCAVENIAAVTFTRKAAAELNGRFQLALEKALAAEADGTKKERPNRALKELNRCFVGTIHSFCAVLLRERPIEAGLDPDFVEMEELEDRLLREQVWEDYLIGLQAQNPQALEELNKIGVDARDLKGCFDTLSAYPEVEPVREPAPPPELEGVRKELDSLLSLAADLLPHTVPAKGWDGLQSLLRKALRWRGVFGFDDDLRLLSLLNALDRKLDSRSITLNRWPNADNAKTMLAAFTAFRKDSLAPALRAWREHRHARLVDFVLPAVELYRRRRMERSRLNFQDLLMNTADLLRQNPEVRRCLQQRYSRLLVDELQDTDPIQAEIMFYLTGRDVEEKDWRRLVPIPGSLFVVGDPKQAIYRFRRADIDTYNEVKRLIAGSGGKVLHLTTNFRSVHALGEWVNPVFKTLLPEDATPYQAAFAGMDTVRDSGGGAAAGIRTVNIPKFKWNNQDEIARTDAARIAAWIRCALDGGVKLTRTAEEIEAGLTENPVPGDFIILLRYKDNMDLYARALEERRIPFCIAGGGGFSNSAETAELLKVLGTLLDPDDPVRLAAVLRGGLFGLSDKQLWRFRQAGGRFSFLEAVPDGLSPGDREHFDWAFGSLRRFYAWTQSLPASAALENIIRELGVVPYALTGELGKSRAGHLIQCLEYAAAAERRGTASFSSLVDYLTILADSGVEEEINIVPGKEDVVRLMNLHKAKGLEAPVVFLANPGKNVKFGPAVHIQRSGDAPRGYFVIEKRKGYASETLGQPLNWEDLSAVEQRYQDAEETRLLYVAATRARNLLVVSTYPEKPEKSPWHTLSPHLTDVPELEAPEDTVAAASEAGIELTADDLAAARESFLGPGSPVCVPSYAAASVTSLVKEGAEAPPWKGTGRGKSWGIAVHRVLEACARKTPANLDLFIENVLAEEGRHPSEKDEVSALIGDILDSPLWRRMLRSKKWYAEVPFAVKTDGEEFSPKTAAGETFISGVIDLVFQEDDGWVIVDYKTDTVENEAALDKLIQFYTPQVEMYRKLWENITNGKVYETGLYFTHLKRWVVVE